MQKNIVREITQWRIYFLCNFNSDDCHTVSVLSDSQSPARHDGRGRLDVLYNGRLLTCRLVGTYSLHHILNRSHYRPAPSSRRHHTHYSCIITQYTCLHRRQCVQSLQVPYQWFCTESPGWRGQQWDFHIQLLALSKDCRSISGYICRQYFAKNTCRPLLYPPAVASVLYLPLWFCLHYSLTFIMPMPP